ncbi:hypothetical protein VW23_001470 [Devosia insulae DS-56]|uniref:Uncharacterized protein n=1 Tax=Devosia insulae DS-56 TaxID=1116389 RepID=A0A1E5XN13_9HYPH|nr:hypothetical protein VW23_001470 [Devosia insulae DS-56]
MERLLPLWEKVAEGRMRGALRVLIVRRFAPAALHFVARTPHPALRATFSHKGRRQEVTIAVICECPPLEGREASENRTSGAR